MRLHVIASFCIIHSILHDCLAASLVERQGIPMITATPPVLTPTLEDKVASSTSMLAKQTPSPADPAPPVIGVPVPEPPKDGVYPISLIASEDDEWDYPVVQVKIGVAKVPINLAVSIYSNETWLLHSSKGVCALENECTVLEPDRLVKENGVEKMWNYIGENGLTVSGNMYKFTSFEPLHETRVKWGLKNFTVGVAWTETGTEGLGKVDGVLGLGPGSTFLQELTNTSNQALSLYLGKDNGTLVIGGYLPKQASGGFTNITTGEDGVVRLRMQKLTLKGDTTEILKGVTATIDPGLPDIVIPKSVQEYLTKNENTKWTMVGNNLQFGADGPKEGERPSFVFDFGDGVNVEMGEEQYTLANEPAFRVGTDDKIILGRSFLRSAYIVMDNTHTTYHLAQANIGNTDTENPIPITVFNNGQGEAKPPHHDDDVDTNPGDSNADDNGDKTSSPSGTEKSKPGKNNTGIIIGGIVAGLVVLAVIFGFILYRHRRSQRQVNEIEGYMGTPKRMSEGSEFNTPPAAVHSSYSPRNLTQENTHLMEGYPIQQHPLGSRESIFREEMNTSGPTPLPPTMQYHYEDDDHLSGMHGLTSRRSPRRDQDLVRTESVISTTDVDLSAVSRSAQNVPRLPMYNTRPDDTAL